ncbi:MAG: DUF932 domain-containing protein, partial [Gemmataceae bacterium]
CAVKDIKVTTRLDKTSNRPAVDAVELDGRPVKPSSRFWNSLHVRFGFTSNIFRYFTHAEVFQRISEVAPSDKVQWCVENGDKDATLLAVTNPSAANMRHDDLMELLDKRGAGEVRYARGVVTSEHAPRLNPTFQIAGDGFQNKFILDTPIDGYGRPAVYLSMLRLICANGLVGYSPTFRSELSVGKGENGISFALERVLGGFNNEEGYSALRQRFEGATKSWASVAEANKLYKVLVKMLGTGQIEAGVGRAAKGGDGASAFDRSPVLVKYQRMSGDLSRTYGLANLDTLSVKRQRTLPAACKIYDLLNFASEVATHHAGEVGNRTLQAYIGELISGEYDLENTADQFSDWRDFFLGSESANETLTSLHKKGRR